MSFDDIEEEILAKRHSNSLTKIAKEVLIDVFRIRLISSNSRTALDFKTVHQYVN